MSTFTKKIKKMGTSSLAIIIPRDYAEANNLTANQIVKVAIKDIADESKDYACLHCGHVSTQNVISPFCPKCGSTELEDALT